MVFRSEHAAVKIIIIHMVYCVATISWPFKKMSDTKRVMFENPMLYLDTNVTKAVTMIYHEKNDTDTQGERQRSMLNSVYSWWI